ncbi:hypothetical protein AC40_5260 [Escherichia coli 2-005-03_S3_C3]|nr:hypothetical protein AC40_5274 [Escherichia coli 2-005-03_S3_C3]KDW62833.1 hypothetical protein AC40_5260 [Escherichia coli 2-005-03_S3_C3]
MDQRIYYVVSRTLTHQCNAVIIESLPGTLDISERIIS